MKFEDCRPYIRFVRELTIGRDSTYSPWVPYDARFFYTKEGAGEIICGDKSYRMTPGDVLCIPAGTLYHLVSPRTSVVYYAVNFDYTQSARRWSAPVSPVSAELYHPEERLSPVTFSDVASLNHPLYLTGMRFLEASLESLVREYLKKLVYYEIRMSAVFFKILTDCLRRERMTAASEGRAEGYQILDYIQTRYAEPLTNETVGEVFGFHKNYASDLIKSLTGKPLHQYLLYVRLTHAWELLEGGGISIGEISRACGFPDICYFSRYFKKVYGFSPSECRAGGREKKIPVRLASSIKE